MDERTLQALSKALTHLVFRNGVVENLHADGACLDNVKMEKINKDINNRIYILRTIWFNGTKGGDKYERQCKQKGTFTDDGCWTNYRNTSVDYYSSGNHYVGNGEDIFSMKQLLVQSEISV